MKYRLFAATLVASLAVGALVASVHAVGRSGPNAGITYVNEGNARAGINTSCLSTSWQPVVAVRESRRSLAIMALEGNGGPICLGTSTTNAEACNDLSLGPELVTRATYTDNSEAALYCRARTGSGSAILKGFEFYDTLD